MSVLLMQYFIVTCSRLIPRLLLIDIPVAFRCPIIIVPANLVNSIHVRVNGQHWGARRRLDADILVPTCMPRVPVTYQDLVGTRVFFTKFARSCVSINQKAGSAISICVRQKMEELKPCRVREIGVVGMGAQELVSICGVFEGEIGSKIPEATYRLVLADVKQAFLIHPTYHSAYDE